MSPKPPRIFCRSALPGVSGMGAQETTRRWVQGKGSPELPKARTNEQMFVKTHGDDILEKELEIEIMQGTAGNQSSLKKAENIQLKSKERSITAVKFVKFESDPNEDYQGKGSKFELQTMF